MSAEIFGQLMTTKHGAEQVDTLAERLELDLMDRYGPVVTGDSLREVLGFPSMGALRQAITRGTISVTIFEIENRRGKFALIKDVAIWLADNRNNAKVIKKVNDKKGEKT